MALMLWLNFGDLMMMMMMMMMRVLLKSGSLAAYKPLLGLKRCAEPCSQVKARG
jgi:hypothetical protein